MNVIAPSRKPPAETKVILITGAIREPLEFLATVERSISLVKENHASHVVVSTWEGQLDNIPQARTLLEENGVHIVETMPPDDVGKGAVNAQFKSVVAGIFACPAGSKILRCRTDKTLKVMKGLEPILAHPLENSQDIGQFKSPFKHKIYILGYSSTAFMWMIDFCFMGERDDLLRALGVSRWFEDVFFNPILSPELRVLSWPFYQENLFLLQLFHHFSQYMLSHLIVDWADSIGIDLPKPIARLMALHAAIHTSSFLCARDVSDTLPAPKECLLRLMAGRPQKHLVDVVYIAGFRGTRNTSSRNFSDLLGLGLNHSSSSATFDQAAAEILDGTFAAWQLEDAEIEDLRRAAYQSLVHHHPMSATTKDAITNIAINRPRSIAQAAKPMRDAGFKNVFLEQAHSIILATGASKIETVYANIATEIAKNRHLIMASLESTILFWCGVHCLQSNERMRHKDGWLLISAASKGRNSDAQMVRGWALRAGFTGEATSTEHEQYYVDTLRDLADAARKNFWPALVMTGLLRLDGAQRHFDIKAAEANFRRAAMTAGQYAAAITQIADFIQENTNLGSFTPILEEALWLPSRFHCSHWCQQTHASIPKQ